jgi:hypothetical protein
MWWWMIGGLGRGAGGGRGRGDDSTAQSAGNASNTAG